MPPYDYSSPALGSGSIRLLRLMPNEDEAAPIQCQLCNYPLQRSSQKTHLYEALSYVWGSSVKDHSVLIDGHDLAITANLHNALSRLRDHYFERIIWADSICINQEDYHEKERQIQLMAKIFSQANRVIVYLGEATDDSDQALEDIRVAAEDELAKLSIDEKRQEAIFKLLERPWFRRIWVLQEVGVARRILIKCGSMEINGFPFCVGVNKLELAYNSHEDLQSLIGPVTYLIRGAIFRTKHATVSSVGLPLGELLDMYHTHEATMRHDKLFALLGMSSDNINTAGLSPNYSISWDTLWQRLVQFVLPKDTFFEAWAEREMAVIKSKGYALGHVNYIEKDSTGYGSQLIGVFLNDTPAALKYEKEYGTKWTLRSSVKPIHTDDIICLLQGASKPAILRPCKDHFLAIMITVNIPISKKYNSDQEPLAKTGMVLREFLLILNWGKLPRSPKDQEGYEDFSAQVNNLVPNYLKTASDKVLKLYEVALVIADSQQYEEAGKRFQKSAIGCEEVLGKESPHTLACLESLALNCKNTKDWNKAAELLWELIPIRKRVQGRNHQDTLNSIANLASTYIDRLNRSESSSDGLESLLDRIRENVHIREKDMIKVGEHEFSKELLATLFELERDKVPVTPKVLNKVAKNGTQEAMALLLDYGGAGVSITEEIVKTAVERRYGTEMITLFFKQRDSEVKITEEVLKAAVGNVYEGKEIMLLLFNTRPHEIKITEEVLKIATGNVYGGKEIMLLLFNKLPHEIKITEEVLKVAAGNWNSNSEIISLFFDRCAYEIKITEEVLKAAAGNTSKGKEIISQIFDRCTHEIKITEEVLKEAASNEVQGPQILTSIHDTFGIKVTLGMIEAAATSGQEDTLKLFDEWSPIGNESDLWFSIARLYKAAVDGDAATVRQLITESTPPDKQNIRGVTPVWIASYYGRIAVVRVLLATGAVNVNVQGIALQTPLFWPAAYGYSEIVRVLLDHGADPDYEDEDGVSPLSMARRYGEYDVVAMLTEHQSTMQKREDKMDEKGPAQADKEI